MHPFVAAFVRGFRVLFSCACFVRLCVRGEQAVLKQTVLHITQSYRTRPFHNKSAEALASKRVEPPMIHFPNPPPQPPPKLNLREGLPSPTPPGGPGSVPYGAEARHASKNIRKTDGFTTFPQKTQSSTTPDCVMLVLGSLRIPAEAPNNHNQETPQIFLVFLGLLRLRVLPGIAGNRSRYGNKHIRGHK